tara:strand:- start:590 stop:871 length:282 start_codon:yes stop_codon:yes gene_type:complete
VAGAGGNHRRCLPRVFCFNKRKKELRKKLLIRLSFKVCCFLVEIFLSIFQEQNTNKNKKNTQKANEEKVSRNRAPPTRPSRLNDPHSHSRARI